MVMTEAQKSPQHTTEAGHAIIVRTVPEHDPVHKVTIIPRGRALGVTFFLPEGDAISASRQKLKARFQPCTAVVWRKRLSTVGTCFYRCVNDIKVATNPHVTW